MAAFRPFGEHAPVMSYHQLPEEVLEDTESLRRWAEDAIASARAKRQRSPNGRRGSSGH
jgi:TfoX/Sxy family transcriptional regulator of competence genes